MKNDKTLSAGQQKRKSNQDELKRKGEQSEDGKSTENKYYCVSDARDISEGKIQKSNSSWCLILADGKDNE